MSVRVVVEWHVLHSVQEDVQAFASLAVPALAEALVIQDAMDV